MKRLTGFINGFIACLLMVYSLIIFVIYKWARCEDVCGFEIKQRYSTNRPKYKYPVKYSYDPSAYNNCSEAVADDIDARLEKIKFSSEEDAKWAKNWLIEQIESYKYVSAFDFLSHAKMLASYTDHKYGWSDANLEEIESLEPNRFNDYWYLDLPPVSYIGKEVSE